jgi:hypothetical protein
MAQEVCLDRQSLGPFYNTFDGILKIQIPEQQIEGQFRNLHNFWFSIFDPFYPWKKLRHFFCNFILVRHGWTYDKPNYVHCPKSSAYFWVIPRSVYILEQVPWQVNFQRCLSEISKAFNPPPFKNFWENQKQQNFILARFNPQISW